MLHVHVKTRFSSSSAMLHAAASRRQVQVVVPSHALDRCWAGAALNHNPPVIVHNQKKQTRCLRRRCRLNRPPPQPHARPRRH
jgi:hypothetical protein